MSFFVKRISVLFLSVSLFALFSVVSEAGPLRPRRACNPCQVQCVPCVPGPQITNCEPCPAPTCSPQLVGCDNFQAASNFNSGFGYEKGHAVKRTQVGPEVSLIQGDTLAGWTTVGGKNPPAAWTVENGVLHLNGKGGDIVTDREYENFILDFVWTIKKGGNSGIKYRFKNFEGRGWLGPEYQVLDDYNTGEGKKPKNNASSLYDLVPAGSKHLNPHDQKNQGRIVVNGNRLEHWINGQKVIDLIVGGDRWKEAVAASKFSDIKGYGLNQSGRIMVQDHNDEVWFHKLTIREIFEIEEFVAGTENSTETSGDCSNSFGCRPICQPQCAPIRCNIVPSCCSPRSCRPVFCPPRCSGFRNFRGCR